MNGAVAAWGQQPSRQGAAGAKVLRARGYTSCAGYNWGHIRNSMLRQLMSRTTADSFQGGVIQGGDGAGDGVGQGSEPVGGRNVIAAGKKSHTQQFLLPNRPRYSPQMCQCKQACTSFDGRVD